MTGPEWPKGPRRYAVATFRNRAVSPPFEAYLRPVPSGWLGCEFVAVVATSGEEAKRLAIKVRVEREQESKP